MVLAVFKGASFKQAVKEAGGSRNTVARIIEVLEKQGNLHDAPRSGRPTVYTVEIMEAAVDVLLEHSERYLTTPMLVGLLKDKGLLEGRTDLHTFLQHLKAHVRSNGHRLITNSTKTTFFLAKQDISLRLSYARMMLEKVTPERLGMAIFTDETQLAEAAHPKGRRPISQPVLCWI